MVDPTPPHHIITLFFQQNAAVGKLDTKAAFDEYQKSCSLLACHPLTSPIATRVDTPLDFYSFAVARVISVLEVPEQPSLVQHRIFPRIAYVYAVVHILGR